MKSKKMTKEQKELFQQAFQQLAEGARQGLSLIKDSDTTFDFEDRLMLHVYSTHQLLDEMKSGIEMHLGVAAVMARIEQNKSASQAKKGRPKAVARPNLKMLRGGR